MRGVGSQRSTRRPCVATSDAAWLRRRSMRHQSGPSPLETRSAPGRYRDTVVPVVSEDDRPQIRALLRNGLMQTPAQLGLDLSQFRLPPRAHRLPQHREPALPRLRAAVREAKKVEGLGFPVAAASPLVGPHSDRIRGGAFCRDAASARTARSARATRRGSVRLPRDAGIRRRSHRRNAPRPRRRAPASFSIAGPRGRRHSAGRCWPAAD